jgi:hypothetical protein
MHGIISRRPGSAGEINGMNPETQPASSNQEPNNNTRQDDLVRQVAERVWQLWQQELRLERERRSDIRR